MSGAYVSMHTCACVCLTGLGLGSTGPHSQALLWLSPVPLLRAPLSFPTGLALLGRGLALGTTVCGPPQLSPVLTLSLWGEDMAPALPESAHLCHLVQGVQVGPASLSAL